MSILATDVFELAVRDAKARRDAIVRHEPGVKVTLTVIGPDNVTRVPCGEQTFARCDADIFADGVLSISSRDDGFVFKEYPAGHWTSAVVYGANGNIDYALYPKGRR